VLLTRLNPSRLPTKAVSDFDQAIRLELGNANFYNNRGNLRRARKVYDLAAADFSEAIRLYPEFVYAYYNRGLTRMDQKEYDLAIVDFHEVIRFDPQDVMAYYHRGLAWSAKEQFESAIQDFDRAGPEAVLRLPGPRAREGGPEGLRRAHRGV